MIAQRLKEFLDKKKIRYQEVPHREALTAQEIAQSVHIAGKKVIKVVIAKGEKKFYLLALPASHKVELEKFGDYIGEKSLRLATEGEIQGLFPDCEVGAMPPFGNLYNLDTYADEVLEEDEEIWIQPGNHTSLLKLKYKDYKKLAQPVITEFARKQVA